VLPNSANFGLSATAGGQDSGGQYGVGQELTIYGDCGAPPVQSSGQTNQTLFGNMQNWWCLPEYRTPWDASSIVTFWWGIGSVMVDEIDIDAGINATPDAYDFCISNIRPILAGDGPDEPGAPLPDAGPQGVPDAGADAATDANP